MVELFDERKRQVSLRVLWRALARQLVARTARPQHRFSRYVTPKLNDKAQRE